MEALHLLHAAFLRGHFSPHLDDWLCFGATEAARAQIANAVFDLGGICEPGGAPETFYASGARLLAAIPRRAWEAARQQDRRRQMARMHAEYPQYFKPNGTLDIFRLVWVGWRVRFLRGLLHMNCAGNVTSVWRKPAYSISPPRL